MEKIDNQLGNRYLLAVLVLAIVYISYLHIELESLENRLSYSTQKQDKVIESLNIEMATLKKNHRKEKTKWIVENEVLQFTNESLDTMKLFFFQEKIKFENQANQFQNKVNKQRRIIKRLESELLKREKDNETFVTHTPFLILNELGEKGNVESDLLEKNFGPDSFLFSQKSEYLIERSTTSTFVPLEHLSNRAEENKNKLEDKELASPTQQRVLSQQTNHPQEKSLPISSLGMYRLTTKTSLREAAKSSSKVLKRIEIGMKVSVLEKTSKYWWKVDCQGKVGHVKALLLEK